MWRADFMGNKSGFFGAEMNRRIMTNRKPKCVGISDEHEYTAKDRKPLTNLLLVQILTAEHAIYKFGVVYIWFTRTQITSHEQTT